MIIWKDLPRVPTRQKIKNCKRHAKRYINRKSFVDICGDVPVVELTENGVPREVVNTRGNAYAYRHRLKYRKTKRQKMEDDHGIH